MARALVLDLAPIVEGGDAADALRRLARPRAARGAAGATAATGSPSTTTCRASRARPPRSSSATWPAGTSTHPRRRGRHHAAEPRAAGDRRAVRHAGVAVSRAASTSGSAARRARTSSPRGRCAAIRWRADAFPAGRRRADGATSARRSRGQAVRAVPGAGLDVPIWILGSSLFGAQLAAELGLPYAFASHFAPAALIAGARVYRARFQPSAQLERPYVMLGVNVVRGRDRRARRGGCSPRCSRPSSTCGAAARGRCRRPMDGFVERLAPGEPAPPRRHAARTRWSGSPGDGARAACEAIVARTGADELMVASQIYDHAARVRSYELLASIKDDLAGTGAQAAA